LDSCAKQDDFRLSGIQLKVIQHNFKGAEYLYKSEGVFKRPDSVVQVLYFFLRQNLQTFDYAFLSVTVAELSSLNQSINQSIKNLKHAICRPK